MFKKGSFEVGGVIYPAAIKYDARFGDAFWNSSKQSYIQYLIMMMTSWAIVVNVRYLPPMTREVCEFMFSDGLERPADENRSALITVLSLLTVTFRFRKARALLISLHG